MPGNWDRVQEVFAAALGVNVAGREEFLHSACGGDEEDAALEETLPEAGDEETGPEAGHEALLRAPFTEVGDADGPDRL